MLADSVHLVSTKQEGKKVKLLGYQLSKVTPVADVPAPVYVPSPDEKGYNGWTNYETWATKLWLDNEEWAYNDVTEQATEHVSCSLGDYEFSNWLQEFVDIHMINGETETVAGLAADLLNSAVSEIDWFEIAKSFLDEAKENRVSELREAIDSLKDEIAEKQVEISEMNDEIILLNLSE